MEATEKSEKQLAKEAHGKASDHALPALNGVAEVLPTEMLTGLE